MRIELRGDPQGAGCAMTAVAPADPVAVLQSQMDRQRLSLTTPDPIVLRPGRR